MVAPIESLLVTVKAIRELAEVFRKTGETSPVEDKMISFDEIKGVLGVEKYLGLEQSLDDDR